MIPDRLPILRAGRQDPGSGAVCAEQAVNWLVSGRLDLGDETDQPECVQPLLNYAAISVNDQLPDDWRQEMWPIILRQPGTARPDMEPRLSMELAAFACRWRARHRPEGTDRRVADAWEAAAVCLLDPTEHRGQAARAAAKAVPAVPAVAAANAWAAAANDRAAAAADARRAAGRAAAAANAARTGQTVQAAGRAAEIVAWWAMHAVPLAAQAEQADTLLAHLTALQDECERLTGLVPTPIDPARIERLCELVGGTR